MKRLLALACMITCIFGLTACGSKDALTEHEQTKVDAAIGVADEEMIPLLVEFTEDDKQDVLAEYTNEEVEHMILNDYKLNVDGYAFKAAVDSFDSALDIMGSAGAIGEATAEIDGDQIIIHVQMEGENKNAEAEVILSNDMFMTLESAALNPKSTMSELMGKAALNTLIGMGTVFCVLILISLIISCFGFIPKIQAKLSNKSKKDNDKTAGIDNAVAQIAGQEEVVDASDDSELVAVIAAAVAAYEGSVSTDGFVVRSIRKVNRGRR